MKLWEGDVFCRVCLCVCSLGAPTSPLPIMYWTSLYSAPWTWDLGPPPPASDIRWSSPETYSNLFTWGPFTSDNWWFGSQDWIPIQIYSLEDPPLLVTSCDLVDKAGDLFKLVHLRTPAHLVVAIETCTVGACGRYASYWNAFLLFKMFSTVKLSFH